MPSRRCGRSAPSEYLQRSYLHTASTYRPACAHDPVRRHGVRLFLHPRHATARDGSQKTYGPAAPSPERNAHGDSDSQDGRQVQASRVRTALWRTAHHPPAHPRVARQTHHHGERSGRSLVDDPLAHGTEPGVRRRTRSHRSDSRCPTCADPARWTSTPPGPRRSPRSTPTGTPPGPPSDGCHHTRKPGGPSRTGNDHSGDSRHGRPVPRPVSADPPDSDRIHGPSASAARGGCATVPPGPPWRPRRRGEGGGVTSGQWMTSKTFFWRPLA